MFAGAAPATPADAAAEAIADADAENISVPLLVWRQGI
jgi:hypothetical protein